MLDYVVRIAKRFAVLIPGLVIAVVSVHTIFPLIDKKVPVALAILLTYIIGAYVLIPALIRLIRVILPARHLQAYSVTPDGFASDPVNIGIVGTRKDLVKAMQAAGWHVADKHNLKNIAQEISSAILNRSYKNAPMSHLYLFGRKQDIGFEIPIEGERGHRHHVRFWATSYRPGAKLNFGTIEWHRQRARSIRKHTKHTLWVGAASKDVGFAFIRHNVQLTHMIDPDTNAERQLIIDGLEAQKLVASSKSIKVAKPYRLVNRAWRGQLHSDGYLKVIKLKR
jgi:hypothetical protein